MCICVCVCVSSLLNSKSGACVCVCMLAEGQQLLHCQTGGPQSSRVCSGASVSNPEDSRRPLLTVRLFSQDSRSFDTLNTIRLAFASDSTFLIA